MLCLETTNRQYPFSEFVPWSVYTPGENIWLRLAKLDTPLPPRRHLWSSPVSEVIHSREILTYRADWKVEGKEYNRSKVVEKAKKEIQMSGMLNCVKYPLISLTLTLHLRFLAMVYVFKFQMNKEGKGLRLVSGRCSARLAVISNVMWIHICVKCSPLPLNTAELKNVNTLH